MYKLNYYSHFFCVDLANDDTSSRLSVSTDDSTDTAASVEGLLDPAVSTPSAAPVPASQLSFKLVGNNIDKTVRPRHMRVDHQAASLHYFNVYAVQDHISFQHLSSTARLIYPEANLSRGCRCQQVSTYCSRFKCIDSKLQSIDETHIGPLFASCEPLG